ncbi:hypothetical protein BX616_001746 [Lobosporangium transversale]|nr:hypothetical protein BX616_001746 [Lobosporangium transversale]
MTSCVGDGFPPALDATAWASDELNIDSALLYVIDNDGDEDPFRTLGDIAEFELGPQSAKPSSDNSILASIKRRLHLFNDGGQQVKSYAGGQSLLNEVVKGLRGYGPRASKPLVLNVS